MWLYVSSFLLWVCVGTYLVETVMECAGGRVETATYRHSL
jgi:hypothetical protein